MEVISDARSKNIPVNIIEADVFAKTINKVFSGARFSAEDISSTQGIIASVSNYNYRDLDIDLKNGTVLSKNSIIVILDEITDVGNFGAILRNCSAFGADGVIISKNRSVEVSNRVSKISSGALEEIRVYNAVNIVSTIVKLKEHGFWVYGTKLGTEEQIVTADSLEYVFPLAIVFGSEGKGIGKLVEKNCDFLVKIEMPGRMQSLNVSTSSGIMLYLINQYRGKNSQASVK